MAHSLLTGFTAVKYAAQKVWVRIHTGLQLSKPQEGRIKSSENFKAMQWALPLKKKKKRLNKKNVANVYSSSQVLIWAQNKIQQIIKQKSDKSGHHVTYKMFKHCFSLFLYTINGHLEPPTALASSHLARYYHTQSQSKFFWKTIYSIFYFKNMDTSEFRTIWFPVRKKCTQRQRTACHHRSLCFTYSASS